MDADCAKRLLEPQLAKYPNVSLNLESEVFCHSFHCYLLQLSYLR